MRKRISQAFITAAVVSAMVVTPVFATPSVDNLKENKQEAEAVVSSLQEQLTQTLDKINTLESDLEEKREEISKASEKLEEAVNRQVQQYESMKLRIKYMYEEGDTSLLEALLTADTFTDLINQATYVQNIHNYDRDKLDEFVKTTKKVETMKDDLQKEATSIQETQIALEEEKSGLNETISSKQSEIAQLDQSIQEAIAAQQAAERAAAEEAQRAAAELAAQQEANRGNNNTGGSSSDNSNAGNNNSGNSNSGSNNSGSGNSGGGSYVPPQGSNGAAVVQYARQFIGNPYVYGGNSLTNGIDCSGFTQQIYAAFGVYLGRTTWDQEDAGVGIPFSQAQAGDLIVYEGHVGIYNGSGGMVHASTPATGIIESASCTYRPIKTVRRVL